MGGSVIFTQWAEGAVRVRGRRVRFVEVGRVRRLVGGSRLRLRAREETGRRWRVENSRMVGRCMLGFELIGEEARTCQSFEHPAYTFMKTLNKTERELDRWESVKSANWFYKSAAT